MKRKAQRKQPKKAVKRSNISFDLSKIHSKINELEQRIKKLEEEDEPWADLPEVGLPDDLNYMTDSLDK